VFLFLIANVNSVLAGSETIPTEENKVLEDRKKALDEAKKAIEEEEISDEDLELLEEYLEQAQDLFDEERFAEAITYYDKVLEIDPSDFDALNGKALSHYNIGLLQLLLQCLTGVHLVN